MLMCILVHSVIWHKPQKNIVSMTPSVCNQSQHVCNTRALICGLFWAVLCISDTLHFDEFFVFPTLEFIAVVFWKTCNLPC